MQDGLSYTWTMVDLFTSFRRLCTEEVNIPWKVGGRVGNGMSNYKSTLYL